MAVELRLTALTAVILTLPWRHNDRDGVSNRQPHDCLLNGLFRRRSKKSPKLRVTVLCVGNSPDRWIPRTKGQLRGKGFHLMTSSCASELTSVNYFPHVGNPFAQYRIHSHTMPRFCILTTSIPQYFEWLLTVFVVSQTMNSACVSNEGDGMNGSKTNQTFQLKMPFATKIFLSRCRRRLFSIKFGRLVLCKADA